MTAIWKHDSNEWQLAKPSGFPAEQALHDLVKQAPNMLPLSGSPRLVIVGREVFLGNNKADLIAVAPSGQLAIIEIKLAVNQGARREIIAQILTYAAFIHGVSLEELETNILGGHLSKRGYNDLAQAAAADDQTGLFQPAPFIDAMQMGLLEGRLRLVLVLDEAPPELVRLVGYLETVSEKLVIDLITVTAYEIAGTKIMVPQRIEPERQRITMASPPSPEPLPPPTSSSGVDAFEASIESVPIEKQPFLHRLADWARALELEGLAALSTTHGKGRFALVPRVRGYDAGLVTVWNQNGGGIQFWRSVFEKRAPEALSRLDPSPDLPPIRQGNSVADASDALLVELTAAYREAAT